MISLFNSKSLFLHTLLCNVVFDHQSGAHNEKTPIVPCSHKLKVHIVYSMSVSKPPFIGIKIYIALYTVYTHVV